MRNLFIKKISIHILLLTVLYLVIAFFLSNIYTERISVFQLILNNYRMPGGWGQTLRRFREIHRYKNIDILFVGSSHAYRSFDPRIFKKHGLTSFNMGSTSQTPLNSYFLLKHYLKSLNPKILIVETYLRSYVSEDGLESFYDLVVNLPCFREMVEMAIATRHPYALNSLVASYLGRISRPIEKYRQVKIQKENYVEGGYCESNQIISQRIGFQRPKDINLAEIQLYYLKKIIQMAQERNIRIYLVMAPFTKEHRESISNYISMASKFDRIADLYGIPFFDFNIALCLDTYKDFKDIHHLNQNGVIKFNIALVRILKKEQLRLKQTCQTNDLKIPAVFDLHTEQKIQYALSGFMKIEEGNTFRE